MVTWAEGVAGDPASGREANFDPLRGPSPCVVRVKAGDALAVPVEFYVGDTDEKITTLSANWAADVRRRPSSELVASFDVDAAAFATGTLILRMAPADSALLRTGMRTDLVEVDLDHTWFEITWEVWGDYTHD